MNETLSSSPPSAATAATTQSPDVVERAGIEAPVKRNYHRPELRYAGTISHLTQGIFGVPLAY